MKRIILLSLIVFISGCIQENIMTITTDSGDKSVYIEIADSEEERRVGLMFRESLAENSGMLFIFPEEAFRSFWMKNTLIPLDIIFIRSDNIIVDIQTMEPCSDPCLPYTSSSPAKYALEVNKGWTSRNGVKPGDRVFIPFQEIPLSA